MASGFSPTSLIAFQCPSGRPAAAVPTAASENRCQALCGASESTMRLDAKRRISAAGPG
jgi:hypothetical protein